MRKRFSLLSALALSMAAILLLQALLVPKYMITGKEGALTGEYYRNAGGNDVIFIGDCEVFETFSPITLWEEYGITSYIRGSAQQTIWQSYYLMEETFRYETPKVMVFNVLSMKYDTPESTGDQSRREAYNRMTLDTMRWSGAKWNAVQASMTREERQWEGIYSYLFPLLRYHDRWCALTQEDFTYWLRRRPVSDNGYLMQTGVKPLSDPHVSPPLADYNFGDTAWDYLTRMVTLCQSHGTKLVLIKAPTLYPVWWWEWDQQIRQFAAENDLMYINMLESLADIGIDWQTDTYDTGLHLNVFGAEKAATWFGAVLSEQCAVPDRRAEPQTAERWAQKASTYHSRKHALMACDP